MRRVRLVAALAIAASGLLAIRPGSASPAELGAWTRPFAEPTIDGQRTDATCVEKPQAGDQHEGKKVTCKPTAGSLAVIGDRELVYWNALEDTEEVESGIALEYGAVSIDDQVRRLTLGPPNTWRTTTPSDGGAGAPARDPLFPSPLPGEESHNDGSLFCSALTFLADGRLLAAGGTAYYHDPAVASKYGVSEVEGLRATRVYDPATNRWTQAGDMNKGRWYPSMVPLADGRVFVASGVKRLIKTAYPDQAVEGGDPADAGRDSGRNVVDTEIFEPSSGKWTENPDSADRSLPLYPRLHLLPNGQIYFNAAGQVFNPSGYAYDEALWNFAAAYDFGRRFWIELGIPGQGTPAPGFRGSTFSLMLPLEPDAQGRYLKARFLTAGGILGTSPGTYFAVTDSRVDTVDVSRGEVPVLSSESTGSLGQPRWYGTGVLAPTGEVIALSGASADEVVGPGTAVAVTTPELWNPSTGQWRPLAPAKEQRTYHNTAALLPDGRILVGGHAPLSTLYGSNRTLVPGVTSPNETRNPTFEIFEPPYLRRGPRPAISAAPLEVRTGQGMVIATDIPGSEVATVVLMRQTAITHLVDGGQRSVVLRITDRGPGGVAVMLPDGNVVPPGPYLLFVNRKTDRGLVPSLGRPVKVLPGSGVGGVVVTSAAPNQHPAPAPPPLGRRVELAAAGAVRVDRELAFHELAHRH